jgi:hypothetical protein
MKPLYSEYMPIVILFKYHFKYFNNNQRGFIIFDICLIYYSYILLKIIGIILRD